AEEAPVTFRKFSTNVLSPLNARVLNARVSSFGSGRFIALITIVPVVAAKTTATPTTIVVFAFVHAIIFKAPLMRVKVEPLAAAPLVIATAVAIFASRAG